MMAGVKVYNKTLERSNKWLSGPIQWEALPEHAVVNRRFGIRQGTKVRLIDDFSGSGVQWMMRELNRQDPGHQWLGKPLTWLLLTARWLYLSRRTGYLSLRNPSTGRPEIFQMHALGARCLGLVWSNYFDDFICMSQDSSSSITSGCVRAFFDLLKGYRGKF